VLVDEDLGEPVVVELANRNLNEQEVKDVDPEVVKELQTQDRIEKYSG